MNTQKLKLVVGTFLLVLTLPNASEAYFTTAQSATQINQDTILYTVTYQFGFLNRELYMPIVATRDLATTSNEFKIGYSILDGNTPTNLGTAYTVALSDDEDIQIKNGQYYLPDKKSAKFTLVTLLKTSPELVAKNPDLSLLVTNLPFLMVKDGQDIPARLNPSELKYYLTPAVKLN